MKQKQLSKKYTLPAGLGIGLLVSIGTTLVMSCVLSWLVHGEQLLESAANYGVLAILLISPAIGAAVAAALIKEKRLIVCMASAACYIILLLACTALFFGGQYQGIGVTVLVVLGGCVGIGLLGLKEEKTRFSARHKIKNR